MGCIPTKALLHTADVWEYFKHSKEQGIHCENPRLDLPLVNDRKDKIVSKHAKGVEGLMKKNKVEWIKGFATLKGGGKVEVKAADGSTQTLEAKNIMIATGSEARMLPGLQPDPQFILTNIEILNLTTVPKTLGIIGAGAVGVEFASIFHRFGTKVTILEMLPRIVPVEDEEVSKELEQDVQEAGHPRRDRREGREHSEDRQGRSTHRDARRTARQEEMEFDSLLIAVGRKPNTDKIGSRTQRSNSIAASSRWTSTSRPDEPGVYAIGDVVAGTPQLAHVATMEGMVAVDHMTGKPCHPSQQEPHPRRDLHRAGHRQRRPDRGAGEGAGLRGEGRQVPVRRQQQGHDPRQPRRLRQGRRRREVRRDPRRPHHRSAGLRADLRSRHRDGSRSHGRDHDAHDPRAPDVVRSRGRGVQRRLRTRDQCVACEVRDCGRIGIRRSVRNAARARRADASGARSPISLLFVEHPHVITLGRNGHMENLLASDEVLRRAGIAFHETDRGGDITYHGPGQIVGYPIFDLREWKRDVVAYVRAMEQAIIDTLAEFGIEGGREPGATGVWTSSRKNLRHRRAHQPLGDVSWLRSESDNRSELFSVHRPVRTDETGDLHAGSRLYGFEGRCTSGACARVFQTVRSAR